MFDVGQYSYYAYEMHLMTGCHKSLLELFDIWMPLPHDELLINKQFQQDFKESATES